MPAQARMAALNVSGSGGCEPLSPPTVSAPDTAPTPTAAIKNPKPSALWWSTLRARSGTYTPKLKTNTLTTSSIPRARRRRAVWRAYATPSRISTSMLVSRGRRASARTESIRSAPITKRKLTPFRRNAGAMPKLAMRSPAAAGPTMRAELKPAEDRATALTRSLLRTSSETRDCRAGLSRVLTKPSRQPRTATCQ